MGLITLLIASGALWIAYGLPSSQRPVLLTNVGVVTLAAIILMAKLRYR